MSTPTKKQLAARHVRRLRTMRAQLLEMSQQWEEVDQFCVNELEDLANSVEAVSKSLHDDEGGAA